MPIALRDLPNGALFMLPKDDPDRREYVEAHVYQKIDNTIEKNGKLRTDTLLIGWLCPSSLQWELYGRETKEGFQFNKEIHNFAQDTMVRPLT